MNLVGKIFIVLILIASTVFMTMGIMVYSTQHNWYEAIMSKGGGGLPEGYQMQLQNYRVDAQKLKDEIQKYDTAFQQEKQAHIEVLAKAETQRDAYAKTNADLTTRLADQEKRLEAAAQALKVTEDNLAAIRKEDTDLREDNRLANKATDEQLKKAQAMEDKLHIATRQLTELTDRNNQLALDVAKARLLLSKLVPGATLEDSPTLLPPTVRGEVLAVDKDNHVEISLGTDDGLREGNMLEIYRGDKYLGRMQVLEAKPHRAVGKILKELQQDVIRDGDQVATRLKA
jgi:hypothetical protein